MIDYHEPDLSTNGTASVRVMLVIGQLTHSCLSKWTELVLHFTKLTNQSPALLSLILLITPIRLLLLNFDERENIELHCLCKYMF